MEVATQRCCVSTSPPIYFFFPATTRRLSRFLSCRRTSSDNGETASRSAFFILQASRRRRWLLYDGDCIASLLLTIVTASLPDGDDDCFATQWRRRWRIVHGGEGNCVAPVAEDLHRPDELLGAFWEFFKFENKLCYFFFFFNLKKLCYYFLISTRITTFPSFSLD